MVLPDTDTLITLPQAARRSRIIGRSVHLSTIHRWRLRGVRGVKLQTWLIGGRRFTSEEALREFIAATNEASDGRAVTECDVGINEDVK